MKASTRLHAAALRGDLFAVACPSRDILKHICNRWGPLILIALYRGPHRFGELRRRIGGVSEKILTQNLRTLADDGLVDRAVIGEVPPAVSYSLTPLGRELTERVNALADWIEERLPSVLDARESAAAG